MPSASATMSVSPGPSATEPTVDGTVQSRVAPLAGS